MQQVSFFYPKFGEEAFFSDPKMGSNVRRSKSLFVFSLGSEGGGIL